MATYYARSDGSAANKAAATGPSSSAAACMNEAVFNGEGFADADIVYFSSLGGAFSGDITLPTGGSDSANKITYSAEPGDTSVSITSGSLIVAVSNITVSGLHVATSDNIGIYISGAISNVDFSDLNLSAVLYAVFADAALTSCTFDDIAITTASTTAFYLSAAGSSALTLTDITLTSCAYMRILNTVGLTIDGLTLTSTTGSYGCFVDNCDGLVQIRRVTSTGSAGCIICIHDSAATGVSVVEDCNLNAGLKGIDFLSSSGYLVRRNLVDGMTNAGYIMEETSNDIVIEDCIAQNGTGDGFSTNSGGEGVSAYDITMRRCQAINCGPAGEYTDSFTSHYDDYNIVVENCVGIGAGAAGAAMVGRSHGMVRNCYFADAGDGTDADRANHYFATSDVNPTTSKGWTAVNNVCANNSDREVWLTDPTKIESMDYNVYEAVDPANKFATVNNGVAEVSWATYHASYEPNSVEGSADIGSAYVPITNGNCDIGKGDPGVRALGTRDLYGRPKLRVAECVGPVYPQRKSVENVLLPIVQLATEVA